MMKDDWTDEDEKLLEQLLDVLLEKAIVVKEGWRYEEAAILREREKAIIKQIEVNSLVKLHILVAKTITKMVSKIEKITLKKN